MAKQESVYDYIHTYEIEVSKTLIFFVMKQSFTLIQTVSV